MAQKRVLIIGAGIAGLVAGLELAARGVAVEILERAGQPGGKMRQIPVGDARIDGGPTVFTMRWVFEEIFAAAGAKLEDHLKLTPLTVLARHAWSGNERLDLFADVQRSEEAIGDFAGAAEARGYRAFCARAKRVYGALERPFIRADRPSPLGLVRGTGLSGMGDLLAVSPFATLWAALGEHFRDPRLRQLFGRYSTYVGSSPFRCPATLMLIAHVEQEGVWSVEGGMHRVARAIGELAQKLGATIRYDAHVAQIRTGQSRVTGVSLADGTQIDADAVVSNADVAALATGLFGNGVRRAALAPAPTQRSLSAVTWAMVAKCRGFPLIRHNVFFTRDYPAEFDAIFRHNRIPDEPTVYVCAQDRGDEGDAQALAKDRLLCLINAPAKGDTHEFDAAEIAKCKARTLELLKRCGLTLEATDAQTVVTSPAGFEKLFPATGGALYGQASHGWMASFQRPPARSRIPGLHLAGGSVHPGAGVPMAALSGRLAAASVLAQFASTSGSRKTGTPGGTPTA
jgi:1-hydroxycarotenoid 3,4-desaturase